MHLVHGRKLGLFILLTLALSMLWTTVSAYSAPTSMKLAPISHDEEDWGLSPDVNKFLNTEWQKPLSENQ